MCVVCASRWLDCVAPSGNTIPESGRPAGDAGKRDSHYYYRWVLSDMSVGAISVTWLGFQILVT